MSHPIAPQTRTCSTRNSTLGRALGLGAVGLLAGCNADSFLNNSSVVGRWEHTPVEVPILSRIAAIEGAEDELVQITEPTAEDLIPEIDEYRIGPGDQLSVVVWDIPIADQAAQYNLIVDARGSIRIPQLGAIFVAGLTPDQTRDAIVEAMVPLVGEGLVSVDIVTPRQDSFTVIGTVGGPGQYFLPKPDYRILEALAGAGWFLESATPEVFVIRQIPLTEEAAGVPPGAPGRQTTPAQQTPTPKGEDLLKIIEDLTKPGGGGGGSPAALSDRDTTVAPVRRVDQPDQPTGPPPIDLIDPAQPEPKQADQPEMPALEPEAGETSWMYLNGRWVQVMRRPAGAPEDVLEGLEGLQSGIRLEDLVTQRVIRINVQKLLSGRSTENIVIRPGDIIRVPAAPGGFVYLGGQITRPGSFNLVDGLTIERVIIAAGGLGQLAVPERLDLTRVLATGRQATIQLDYRAIVERTQPDIYLKRDDIITIGSNFWAYPMAVIRNGFRATYGFGFLLDRNFGNDVFGAPPVNFRN
ncbi:MAG: polysaccharide biosynthesis/export family protein [Planctomycetes bacterium]|nr:polysaccharide biosynthesis/export family protein [Planctomycetota bacterium]